MHPFLIFNGQILKSEEPAVSAVSSAALYGKGIFTTLAVYDSKPFLWEKHLRRLADNAKRLSIDLTDFPENEITASLSRLIEKNQITNARMRLTFFDESSDKIWSSRLEKKTSLMIVSADFREIPQKFLLGVSPFPVNSASPLAGIKSCNYLENMFALRAAVEQGFNEAVRLNERGEIVSACMANIFWRKDGKTFTPCLETGALAGTMRELCLEQSEIFQVRENIEVLSEAEEIFLTSAGIGKVVVSKFVKHNS